MAEELHDAMAALGVREPDVLTRVTEYVPKIVEFVKTIIDKGLAYESNGSVYMDISKMRACGHAYPKLEPSKGKATEAEMAESEGTFTAEAADVWVSKPTDIDITVQDFPLHQAVRRASRSAKPTQARWRRQSTLRPPSATSNRWVVEIPVWSTDAG